MPGGVGGAEPRGSPLSRSMAHSRKSPCAACPQLAEADMRAFGRHSGFDPKSPHKRAYFGAMHRRASSSDDVLDCGPRPRPSHATARVHFLRLAARRRGRSPRARSSHSACGASGYSCPEWPTMSNFKRSTQESVPKVDRSRKDRDEAPAGGYFTRNPMDPPVNNPRRNSLVADFAYRRHSCFAAVADFLRE